MTQNRQDIGLAVAAAQRDSEAADAFVRQYMGFIRSETVKFIHTAPENGHEDELSIAMLAFYEAILGYQKTKGPFLAYAARSGYEWLVAKVVRLLRPREGQSSE